MMASSSRQLYLLAVVIIATFSRVEHHYVDAFIPGLFSLKTKPSSSNIRQKSEEGQEHLLTVVLDTPFHVKVGYLNTNQMEVPQCTFAELHQLLQKLEKSLIEAASTVLRVNIELAGGHLVPDAGYTNPVAKSSTQLGGSGISGISSSSFSSSSLISHGDQGEKVALAKHTAAAAAVVKQEPTPSPTPIEIESPTMSAPTESAPTSPTTTTNKENGHSRRLGKRRVAGTRSSLETTTKRKLRSTPKFVWGGTGSFVCRGCSKDDQDKRRDLFVTQLLLAAPEAAISVALAAALTSAYQTHLIETNQKMGCLGDGKIILAEFNFLPAK